ncbi:imidazolonepropionase-like amidohydrolase [Nocardiopsis sp. Huas11]|uniref:metal-dependent hydrolase family protein n=1 Tax=Nocardiopsis sp. Huas11 TaxID=2183912 RepID=UPI000F2CD76C|nr:amidohydrolase family protein [Nocardiopsis sp. Huas11]RKS10460.1 imidazolonepropionase-like amidohydrolase [Nocardiopsis sp. Huas11]
MTPRPGGERTVVVRGGAVIDGTGAEPRPDHVVVVRDGRIDWIGPAAEAPHVSGPHEEVDAAGGTVLPGFVDAHVHMTMPAGGMNPADLLDQPPHFGYYAAIPVLRDTLDAGVTSVRDLAGLDMAVQKAVDDGIVAGPRTTIAYRALGPTGGHGDFRTCCGFDSGTAMGPGGAISMLTDGVDEALRNTREAMRKGAGVIKVMASGGVWSPRDTPWHDGLNVEEMTVVVREAAAHGVPVAAHAQSARSIRNALTAGVTSVEHGYEIDAEGIELMLDRGAFLVPTLSTATTPPDPAKSADYAVAKKLRLQEHLGENISAAIAAGVRVALGTDSGICPHGRNLRELALLVDHGMSPMGAVLAGTRDAAELLGVADQVGTLEPGKRADLVVCEGDPLSDITLPGDPANIRAVLKDGRAHKGAALARTGNEPTAGATR